MSTRSNCRRARIHTLQALLILQIDGLHHLRQQSHMLLWTKAGQYGCAGQIAMEANTIKTANPTLLPCTTIYQQHVRASTGAIQIHLEEHDKLLHSVCFAAGSQPCWFLPENA